MTPEDSHWLNYGTAPEHEHVWAKDVQHGRITGEPSRACTVEGCRAITLDLSDDEEEE